MVKWYNAAPIQIVSVLCTLGLYGAIVAGHLFFFVYLLVLAVFFFVCLVCCFLKYKKPKNSFFASYAMVVLVSTCVIFFSYSSYKAKQLPLITLLPDSAITGYLGQIESSPVYSNSGNYSVVMRVDSVYNQKNEKFSAIGTKKLYMSSSFIESYYPGKLFSKPNRSTDLIDSGAKIRVRVEAGRSSVTKVFFEGWQTPLARFRSLCRLQLNRIVYSWKDAGGLLLALITGTRTYLETSVGKNFKNTGLAHILALSGMHLSIFGGMAFSMGKLGGKKISLLLYGIMICLFVWFAGNSPSLFRALLGALIVLAARFLSVKISQLSSLCAAFIVHIVLFPEHCTELAFLLSYAALLGILLFSSFFERLLVPFVPTKLATPLAASIAAQVCTAPLSILFFSTLMPIGIIVSVIISPLVSWFFIYGIIAVCATLLAPLLLIPLGCLLNLLYSVICLIVAFFAQVPPLEF